MMDSRHIKLWLCIACLAVTMAAPATRPELYLDIIDMAAISRMTPQQLETLAEGLAAEEIMRTKRSSAQALTSVAAKASSGLQSKLGLLGQASAFISSASSKSGGEHPGYSYEPHHHHDEKYDYWGLKKSILYTLFQAVKAITGGVTILKGQLIKGGGALASTLGKVIAGKGDVVSNLGKKIVSSAALSEKKPHASPVYGPPPTAHIEYGAHTAYGSPTAPAVYTTQYAAGHSLTDHSLAGPTITGPSYVKDTLPTGYAAHKYPASLDGRGKLSGVHAGLVFLTPLEHTAPETLETAHSAHTPLEPPSSIIHTVFSAIKNAFSTVPVPTAPAPVVEEPYAHQPPPPAHALPDFKPMSWGTVNSYGEPASADAYLDYNPVNPHPQFHYATSKHYPAPTHKTGLTPEKIQKISFNLKKLNHYMNHQARSSEDLPKFNGLELMKNGPLMPTQVVSDNEIGVLPAELLPDLDPTTTTSTTTTTTTTTSTTETPKNTTVETRRTDFKYFLRGNRIVLV